MSADVWIGAVLSIPIGIATGLAVTPAQRWIENRGKQKALVQSKRVKADYDAIIFYRLHPHIFTQYCLQVVIKTTFIAAAVGIISGCIYAFAQATSFVNIYRLQPAPVLYVLAQITAIASSILIINNCRPALKTWQRVRNFEEYIANIPSDIRDLNAESLALRSPEDAIAPPMIGQ
jgi:hypothetical protein